MRLRRGFFRIWIVLTVLWVAMISALQINDLRTNALPYQYEIHLRKQPWEINWSAPFYENAVSPTAGHLNPTFSRLDWQYLSDWEQRVQDDRLQEVTFPDSTRLFLDTRWNEADAQFLSRSFWEQRWHRYWDRSVSAVIWALALPIVLLMLGAAVFWIAIGFKGGPKPAPPAA